MRRHCPRKKQKCVQEKCRVLTWGLKKVGDCSIGTGIVEKAVMTEREKELKGRKVLTKTNLKEAGIKTEISQYMFRTQILRESLQSKGRGYKRRQ